MTPPHGGGGNPRYYPDPSRGGRPAYNSQQHGVDVIRSNSGQGGFYKIARYNRRDTVRELRSGKVLMIFMIGCYSRCTGLTSIMYGVDSEI